MIATLLAALLPLLFAAATDAAPAPGAPALHLGTRTVRADDNGTWNLSLTMVNPGGYGLYGDSLFVDITDLDAGVSRAPRRSTLAFPFIIKQLGTVGSKEERSMELGVQAPCERAHVVVRLYAHAGGEGGARYALRESLDAQPGELSSSLPSAFLEVKGKRVEIVTATPAAAGTAPGVLLVPAETAHARRLLRTAAQLAGRGMNVVVVSPPGYGQSDGPADMAGPATLAALEAALAKLATLPGTDGNRLAVWGAGRGATAALLLAARHPEIRRVVAQDAGYDLWASWRSADEPARADIVAEAGRDSAAWKARSPQAAGKLAAAVLVMHAGGPEAPEGPARAWAAARFVAQAPTDTVWTLPGSHRLRKDALRTAIEFLAAPADH